MSNNSNSNPVYHHITLFIWISWFLVFLSGVLMFTFTFGFTLGLVLGGISMLFSLVYLVKSYIEHWTEYIVLESSCITMNTGIIWKTKSQIPYYKINNISISDFLWIHNLTLDTGNDTTNIHFNAIQRPHELKRIINERIEQERHFGGSKPQAARQQESDSVQSQYADLEKQSMMQFQPQEKMKSVFQNSFPQQNTPPPQERIIDELERLNQLKIQGALSQVEFEFAKKRVLMGK